MAADALQSTSQREAAAAALRASAQLYDTIGTPLYATLCAQAANEPDIVTLVMRGRAGAAPMHLLSSVHYLLLRDPNDTLSAYFATLTPDCRPPETAYPEFRRFCREHHREILHLLDTRTVQTTYVDRCRTVMPLIARVADEAGEPLNLIEIGCSAGVLLTFDRYAYRLQDGRRLGAQDVPLTLSVNVTGGRVPRIPAIGRRIGLDLHIVDVRSADERRWLLALSFPEHREQQAALATALEVVAHTPIETVQGDALHTLPAALATTPDPLCVFHSACLMYWPSESKAALEALFLQASAGRDLYRVAIEPTERFNAEQRGQVTLGSPARTPIRGEAVVTRYRRGVATRIAAARTTADYGSVEWVG